MSKIEVNAIEPQCGTTLTIGASDTSIAGIGTVNWDTTAKTAAFTAVSGRGYFVNTTSGAITVTLPASPSSGNIVSVSDYNGTASTNTITIARNGSNINGDAEDFLITKADSAITFVYVDGTVGWTSVQTSSTLDTTNPFIAATGGTETECGDFKIHTFTGPGTFTVTNAGNPSGSNTVDYLVVAGGAAGGVGGGGAQGAGGGAGGYRESSGEASGCYTTSPLGACVSALPVSIQGYPITVGAGGASVNGGSKGNNGSNTVFSTITSAGGGGGGGGIPSRAGNDGGSGGGAARDSTTGQQGSGNTPPVSPPQGNPGSTIPAPLSGEAHGAGGGGGATGAGGVIDSDVPGCGSAGGGKGGVGANSSITGSPVVRAGGGGGTAWHGAGGAGGGSPSNPTGPNGVQSPAAFASAGGGGGTPSGGAGSGADAAANTGSGGGGGYGNCGTYYSGDGGSGIVIIRYKFQ